MALKDIFKEDAEFRPYPVLGIDTPVEMRAYRTEEEKDVLVARATKRKKTIETAVLNLIKTCTNVSDPKSLPKAVIAEIVKQLRIISYDSKVPFTWDCGTIPKDENGNQNGEPTCNVEIEDELDLEETEFVNKKTLKETSITLGSGDKQVRISFNPLSFKAEEQLDEMTYDKIDRDADLKKLSKKEKEHLIKQVQENEIKKLYALIAFMIDKVITKEETYSNLDFDEKFEFVMALPKKHFEVVLKHVLEIDQEEIVLQKECKCPKCGNTKNVILGRDLSTFLL